MRYFRAFVSVLALVSSLPLSAQTINPYNRMVDPLALAKLNEPDFAPLKLSFGYLTAWWQPDTTDPGYYLYAFDTGAGIITHLFVTSRVPDSQTTYKLFVDGSLLRTATMQNFFDSTKGFFNNPLDTIIGEARLGDVQIPYHHGFKLTLKDPIIWYDYAWRPLPSSANLLPSCNLNSSVLLQEESQADSVYRNPLLLWKGVVGHDSSFSAIVGSGSNSTLLTINGSNIVKNIWLLPSYYDTTLDSVWLDIYWDGEATPSVSTSLLSLFGQSYDFRDLHSLPIDFSQDSGFTMRLPMPFASSMRIVFRNASSKLISIQGRVSLVPQTVDLDTFGYLHAHYSQVNPTKYGVPHHVLNIKGKGKYIGLLMGIHDLNIIGTYEGNAEFAVDSNFSNSFQYEGLEDYFNGAAYFSYGNFFMPFGGTSNRFANFFRFHYLDAMDFRSSFEFEFQHAVDNNAHEYYRTLAFWYQRQILFWTSRDTIRSGENWEISGAGYSPNEPVDVLLDSMLIGRPTTSSSGTFNLGLTVSKLPVGFHILSVNGVPSPYTIFVIETPTIQLLDEPKPLSVKTGDTLHFSGAGFILGDSIIASLAGQPVYSKSTINANHEISGWLIVPELTDSTYFVSLYGTKSGFATSTEPIQITRTLRYECEGLWTDSTSKFGTSQFLPLLNYLPNDFSHTAALGFRPDSTCREANERFFVPYSDTFSISFQFGRGTLFGNFDILMDDTVVGHIIGFDSTLYESDSLMLGMKHIPTGEHALSFHYTGHDVRTSDSVLWADFIQLTPTDPFANSEVSASVADSATTLMLFPNPAESDLVIEAPSFAHAGTTISITDQLGREVLRAIPNEWNDGTTHCSIAQLLSGMYRLKLEHNGFIVSKSFIVIH